MKLTKAIIESVTKVETPNQYYAECYDDPGASGLREFKRLALLGLESEQEADALRLRAQRRDAAESDAINAAFGAFPDLDPDTEPERDTRAERIGRAVLAWVGDRILVNLAADARRHWPNVEPLLRAIADAMEDEAC